MIPGNACAVSYKNKWFRAEMLEAPANDKIKVCFVDYGTIDDVGIAQCYYLSKDFTSIPKLCYPGTLECIDKTENPFIASKLVRHFSKMVQNKPLAGVVTKVDYKVWHSI